MKKILLPFIISLTSLLFPIVNLSLGTIGENSVEIIIYTDMDIAGFQFDIDGVELSGGSGGFAEDNGFQVHASGNTALGFSISGDVIPAWSDGVLTILEGNMTGDVCLPFVQDVGPNDDTPIIADTLGNALDVFITDDGSECGSLSIEHPTFSLFETYPNPFNPQLNIAFEVNSPGQVTIKAYDVSGRYIETIYDGLSIADQKKVMIWDASKLTSGIYIIKMQISDHEFTKIVNLIK